MQSGSILILENRLLSLIETNNQATNQPKGQQVTNVDKKDSNNSLTLSYIAIQKFPESIKKIFQQHYQNLIELSITNCDLRTFENFPKLQTLRKLNVSKNSLRGSFQFVVKNRSLKYIDVSNNIIPDVKKFQPLRCLKEVSLYAKFNPFDSKTRQETSTNSKSNVVDQLKALGIKYLDKPISSQKQVIKKQQKQKYSKPSLPQPIINRRPTADSIIKQRRNRRSLHQQILERIVRRESMASIERGQVQLKPTNISRFNDLSRPPPQSQMGLFIPNYSSQSQEPQINLPVESLQGIMDQNPDNDNDEDQQFDDGLDIAEQGLFNVLHFSDREHDLFHPGTMKRIAGMIQLESDNQQDQDDDQDGQEILSQQADSNLQSQDNNFQ